MSSIGFNLLRDRFSYSYAYHPLEHITGGGILIINVHYLQYPPTQYIYDAKVELVTSTKSINAN